MDFPVIRVFLCFLLVAGAWSCYSPEKETLPDSPPIDTLPDTLPPVPQDTLTAHRVGFFHPHMMGTISPAKKRKLEENYEAGWMEHWDEDDVEDHYTLVMKGDFTGDGVQDYLLIEEAWRFKTVDFIDGKSGRYFGYSGHYVIWPDINYNHEVEIVDVGCGDGQVEVLVKHRGNIDLFRYNRETGRVQCVFTDDVFDDYMSMKSGALIETKVNYIDFIVRKPRCFDTIRVHPGVRKQGFPETMKPKSYTEIWPRGDTTARVWALDKVRNQFIQIAGPDSVITEEDASSPVPGR